VSRLHQAARHVAAHFAESDNTDLHLSSPVIGASERFAGRLL